MAEQNKVAPKKPVVARQKPDAKPTSASPSEPVEILAGRIPSVQKIIKDSSSPLFGRFMSELYPLLNMPKTAQYVLEAFSSRDVTAEKVSAALKANASIEQVFYQVIEAVGKRTDVPSLEAAVVLIGMQNSRNMIVALQLLKAAGLQVEWTKEGKMKTVPADYLKYALKTEELVAGPGGVNAKEEYADLAFASGIFFDVLVLLASRSDNKKKLLAYIEEIYNQSIKSAMIAAEIVRILPEFNYKRLFFATCLLHDVGKIAMAILEPKYLDFSETCTKKTLPRPIRRFAEAKRFGINHSVLGAVTCYSFAQFSPVARAILYQHEPFLLSTRKKNLYQLTALVALSNNIATQFKKTDKTDDPILAVWKGPELKDFKIDNQKLLTALSRVK
jgi:HD-like signal output (HDOD) protein